MKAIIFFVGIILIFTGAAYMHEHICEERNFKIAIGLICVGMFMSMYVGIGLGWAIIFTALTFGLDGVIGYKILF